MSEASWAVQREMSNEPIPTPKDIIALASLIKDERSRALFSLLYLTAGRVSEVISLEERQIRKVKRKEGYAVYIENIPSRKNPDKKFRDLPILIDDRRLESRKPLCEYVFAYLKKRKGKRVFDFGSRRAEQLLFESTGMNPHWVCHIACTHLSKFIFKGDVFKLRKWRGWKTIDQAVIYAEYVVEDLI